MLLGGAKRRGLGPQNTWCSSHKCFLGTRKSEAYPGFAPEEQAGFTKTTSSTT